MSLIFNVFILKKGIKMDGWVEDLQFYVLWDDGRMVMKGYVQWNSVYG